jgi:hypothetical protein
LVAGVLRVDTAWVASASTISVSTAPTMKATV